MGKDREKKDWRKEEKRRGIKRVEGGKEEQAGRGVNQRNH